MTRRFGIAVLGLLPAMQLPAQPMLEFEAIGSVLVKGNPVSRPSGGFPFSGTETIRHARQSNGESLVTETKRRIFRDAQGRTRVEIPFPMRSSRLELQQTRMVSIVQITDPVARVVYTLEPWSRTAHRSVLKVITAPPSDAAPTDEQVVNVAGRPMRIDGAIKPGTNNVVFEKLGRKMFEGKWAEGLRWTVRPAIESNSLQPSTEVWTLLDSSIVVQTINTLPFGETTTSLQQIDTANPDASLFKVPSDYAIVDQLGQYRIRYPVE